MNNNHIHDSTHGQKPARMDKSKLEEINKILDTEGKYTIHGDVHQHGKKLESIRRDEHKGHKIVITTTYDIEVDGKKIFPHLHVNNKGTVATHTLPNYASNSAMELVKTLIDCFPEDFKRGN